MVYEWNSQRAKTNWCQRERWHHLPYLSLICGLGQTAVNDRISNTNE